MRRLLALIVILTLGAAALWSLSQTRNYQLFGTLVARVETTQPLIALTFDGGPQPGQTEALLGILSGRGVRATFFVTGRAVVAHPHLAATLVAAGHELGNQSFGDTPLLLVRPAFVEDTLARTDAAIRAAGFTGPILFRPPQGRRLFVLPWVLAQQGRTTVMWDIAPDQDANAGAERIVRAALDGARPGSILRLHAMDPDRTATRAALPGIIDGLRARGFRLVTVAALIAATP